eukprot:NODE_206_length_12919_cov_0.381357.p1 type:complete len:636 gc:universal NODE_206_length_12919_cov_0.381357:8104-6197(-)
MTIVDYVLLSEFDILKGSTLRQQYPTPTGVDEQVLAELMLPEGGHSRDTDWTWFFLHHFLKSNQQMYALNLVMTKKDDTAQRGARMKALAICSTKPFLHVFRPLLVLTLDQYFKSNDPDMLKIVFEAINNSDISKISPIPEYRRKIIEQTETTQFNRTEVFKPKMATLEASTDEFRDRTKSESEIKKKPRPRSQSESAKKRQTVSNFDQIQPQENVGLIRRRASVFPENKTQQVTISAYKVSMKLQIPIISTKKIERIGEFSIIDFIQKYNKAGTEFPTGPMIKELHSSGVETPNLIVLINAVLTGKRVLFLGHAISASEVCQHVLALVSIASGNGSILRGISKRCFPYCSIFHLDTVLGCPGYIAGVTNPAYETKTKWWDVLVNVKTGEVTISPDCVAHKDDEKKEKWFKSIIKKDMLETLSTEEMHRRTKSRDKDKENQKTKLDKYLTDFELVEEVVDMISNRCGEHFVRMKLQEYIERFVHLLIAYEREEQDCQVALQQQDLIDEVDQFNLNLEPPTGYTFFDSIDREELKQNKARILAFRSNEVYKNLVEDFKLYTIERPCKGIDLGTEIVKLRQCSNLSIDEVRDTFVAFEKIIKQPNQIEEVFKFNVVIKLFTYRSRRTLSNCYRTLSF